MKLLQDINMRGTTVVVVTHDKEVVDGYEENSSWLNFVTA